MLRFVDRHLSLVIVVFLSLVAKTLENYFGISNALVDMARCGSFVSLSATLVGFLITGLTILLAFSDRPSIAELAKTRAYRYVHQSFIHAIWFQVTLLVYSLVLEVIFRQGYETWFWIESLFLYVVMIAMALLLVCVYYLSIMVMVVVKKPSS